MTTTATSPLTLPSGSAAADFGAGEVTFIGTATVLVRYAGFTVLTDPNFLHRGEHAYIGLGVTGSTRSPGATPTSTSASCTSSGPGWPASCSP